MLICFLSVTVHPLKVIESKDLSGYAIFVKGNLGRIIQGQNYAFKFVSPGMTGENGSISLQTFDNKWLIENNSKVVAAHYDRTRRFKYLASFILAEDKWFPGFSTFESSVNPNHFLRHDSEWIRIDKFQDSADFKSNASWKMTERGKIYLTP